ncbi:SctK family type III secretion system sorting platform protein [Bradyrhizobium sp.]|uniref:SctK family type III secretion system sorting platform protein n=1 Tax=Bradyrhizobium sp. TaxID=376 RepID=UPI003C465788
MTGPTNRTSAEMDWATLMRSPAAYIDVSRLAACFDGSIGIKLCERLRATGRLQNRLSDMISDFYALPAPVSAEAVNLADQKVALLAPGKTGDLIRRAGAAYWANAIANAVRADEVRRLRARLGEALYAFALANRQLSGPPAKLDLTDEIDVQITQDGTRCFGAWCASQPEAVGSRVRLKSAASPALDDSANGPFRDIGAAIIRGAAA